MEFNLPSSYSSLIYKYLAVGYNLPLEHYASPYVYRDVFHILFFFQNIQVPNLVASFAQLNRKLELIQIQIPTVLFL